MTDPQENTEQPTAWRYRATDKDVWQYSEGAQPNRIDGWLFEPLFTADEPGLWRFWNEKAQALAAENARLREALEDAAEELEDHGAPFAASLARAALTGGGNGN